jgi:metal-sulfur cluster biosynthetic enzyme
MLTTKQIWSKLNKVPDPELGISIVDLGLVYAVNIDKKGNVEVIMTLTTMGCPLFDLIQNPVMEEIKKLKGVKKVTVELTFDPPWNTDRMSEDAKAKMGFF